MLFILSTIEEDLNSEKLIIFEALPYDCDIATVKVDRAQWLSVAIRLRCWLVIHLNQGHWGDKLATLWVRDS